MDVLVESLTEEWQNLVRLLPRIVSAAVAVGLFGLAGSLVGRMLLEVLSRTHFERVHLEFFRRLILWGFVTVGVLLALNILDFKVLAASLVAGGGVTAVVIGFAFREIGENLLAGVALAFSRPFEVGDLIQCGEFQGTVRAIELRSTHIRSPDGRDIFIPSSRIFSNPLANFTLDGLRRIHLTVGIDYGDDSEQACQALDRAVRSVKGVLEEPAPRVHLDSLAPQYVEMGVSFWVDTKGAGMEVQAVRSKVLEACRRALMEARFTVSANVTSNVALSSPEHLKVRLSRRPPGLS